MTEIGKAVPNNTFVTPHIAAVGIANPPHRIVQAEADRLLSIHYAGQLKPRSLDIMHKVLAHPSIRERYASVGSIEELIALKNEDPDVRAERFTRWSVELSAAAIKQALNRAGIDTNNVTTLIVNTCTGYICPGISTYLIEHLGLSPDIRAYDMVGSGCGGAIPNLQIARSLVAGNADEVVVSVSVEICTATFQMGNDISLIISNAIFGDGAAAAVVWGRPQGLVLHATKSRFVPEYRADVRYIHKNGQLHNQLSPQLPRLNGEIVPLLVRDLLAENRLPIEDIGHWAIHPGGDRILDILAQKLDLNPDKMAVSRGVLADYGNMSSPTVLFELKRIMDTGVATGDWCMMVAFGAGFSVHAYLLQGV